MTGLMRRGNRASILVLLAVPLGALAWWCAVKGVSLYTHPERLSDRTRRRLNRVMPFPD